MIANILKWNDIDFQKVDCRMLAQPVMPDWEKWIRKNKVEKSSFTTYLVQEKQEDTITLCVDERSMMLTCQELKSKNIGYIAERLEREEGTTGRVTPKITVLEEWSPRRRRRRVEQ